MPGDVGKRGSMGEHRLPHGNAGSVPFSRTPLLAPVYGFVIAGVLTLVLGSLFAGGPDNSGSVVMNQGGTATSTTQAAAPTTTAPTPTPPPTTPPLPTPTTSPPPPPPAAPSLPLPLTINAMAAGVPPSTFNGNGVAFSTAGKRNPATKLGPDGSTTVQVAALPLDEVCLTPKTGWQVDNTDGGITVQRDGRTGCLKGPGPPPSGQHWVVTFTLIKAGQ